MQEPPEEAARQGASPYFFIFLANTLALDLVNTDVVLRRRRRELLPTSQAVAAWWEAARQHYPHLGLPAPTPDDPWRGAELLERIKQLRATLRTIFAAITAGQPLTNAEIEPLNEFLRLGYQRLEVSPGGQVLPGYGIHQDRIGMILLPIALSAYELLTQADRERLHACGNSHCVALFYDTSRSGTRRWCSEGCMNRARSAEHYAQLKSAQARAGSTTS